MNPARILTVCMAAMLAGGSAASDADPAAGKNAPEPAQGIEARVRELTGADAAEYMYARGDTVDFQLGTDPNADELRAEADKGDLRLSIGNFQGEAHLHPRLPPS